ncbi:ABC transporter substrate-binding protein [Roseomonas marmotae]|uniref:Thiamine pyrimidine synthase n=1 Tax=Roseomonas marmotae TaxID=2768161 RepID=A0ABS3KAF0_9PROT|nr:ABC transporter substrate-binding protein [Roseomonas marmotae]MBO1074423.1 ABC transporter substrate-binding protein [Roseomonas marmotae]QTI78160.1 ABC transporter substrate-binding protein [Roseomonas marmotae]
MQRRHLMLAAGAALAMPAIRPAAAQGGSVRFALDWALQGNHGMWILADDKGFFRDAGLSVKIDRGFGSGDTAVKVASGAYEMGFTDISTAVKLNADNPDKRLVSIYQVFDRTATALITLKGRGITNPREAAGKKLGAPEGEASRMIFPAFAQAAGIDAGKINWTSMAASLRDTMLAQGQVDAVTGFLFTTYFNLVGVGIPEDNILAWPYAENGLDLYGSAIVARADWLEKNPQVAASFVKASMLGLRALLADVPGGMAAIKKREPLFDEALEARRFAMTRDRSILTPNVRQHGLGYLDMARAETLIRVNAEAYGVKNPPSAASMFTDKFLPPAADRQV